MRGDQISISSCILLNNIPKTFINTKIVSESVRFQGLSARARLFWTSWTGWTTDLKQYITFFNSISLLVSCQVLVPIPNSCLPYFKFNTGLPDSYL